MIDGLPDALAGHLVITVVPLTLGVLVSVPLGLLAVRHRWLRGPLLAVVGLIQTIPGLALLALMVPILVVVGDVLAPLVEVPALGPLPVLIALTLYAMLPVARNTVAGVEGVDARLLEAAQALGMTRAQVLRQVELPLAAPVILAGIRTAAVWVVGMGTLATPVGQTSLGNFIFAGLQTRDVGAVLVGCLGSAALALVVDTALAGVERAVRDQRPRLAVASLMGLAGLVAVGLALPGWGSGPTVIVASKPFTEQYVLARLLERQLSRAGFDVTERQSMGSSIVLDGLLAGEIDVYVDYSGTLWANHLRRDDVQPSDVVLDTVCAALAEEGARCVGPLGFENAYALAARRDRGWTSLTDLEGQRVEVGGDYEFFRRPEWDALQEAYGLHGARERVFDPTFLYEAVATGEVDLISAYTSDGRIAAFDLVTLDDPRGVLPPYDAVLLVGPDAPEGVFEALVPLVGSVDVAAMREANRLVDVEGRRPAEAAATLDYSR